MAEAATLFTTKKLKSRLSSLDKFLGLYEWLMNSYTTVSGVLVVVVKLIVSDFFNHYS